MLENPALRQAIGQRIQARRRAQSLSQEDLAHRLGVNQGQVSAWERGTRSLRLEEAMAIAKVLQTTVGCLVGEPPPDTAPASSLSSHTPAADTAPQRG